MPVLRKVSWLTVALLLAGCATGPLTGPSPAVLPSALPAQPAPVPELRPGVPAGYLGRALPDSLALLPPPPTKGSPGFARDQAISRASQKLKSGPRYALASRDADLRFPQVASTFSCALGVPISQQDTPRLYLLLQRSLVDAGLATYAAKDHYKRTRPFVFYKEKTCFPADEASLRSDGSYPSGHTAIGWAWALLLGGLRPAQAAAVRARGRPLSPSTSGDRLGLGAAAERTPPGPGRCRARTRPCVRRKPADLQRALAERRAAGACGRRGRRRGAACQ